MEKNVEHLETNSAIVGQKVKIKITETPRGLFANSVSLLN